MYTNINRVVAKHHNTQAAKRQAEVDNSDERAAFVQNLADDFWKRLKGHESMDFMNYEVLPSHVKEGISNENQQKMDRAEKRMTEALAYMNDVYIDVMIDINAAS